MSTNSLGLAGSDKDKDEAIINKVKDQDLPSEGGDIIENRQEEVAADQVIENKEGLEEGPVIESEI